MLTKRILIFMLILLPIIQCSKKNATGPDTSKNIWPLSIGNTWSYIKNSQNDTIVHRMTVIGIKKVNNFEVPMVKTEDFEYNHIDTLLFGNEDNGVYWYLEDGSKFLIFKYPVKVGESWPNPFEGGKIECISINKTINTPAGKFSCIVYKFFGEENDKSLKPYVEIYMSLNIGWVATKTEGSEDCTWLYRIN